MEIKYIYIFIEINYPIFMPLMQNKDSKKVAKKATHLQKYLLLCLET